MVLCAYNSSTGNVEAGGSEVQGHCLSQREKQRQAGDVALLLGCLPSVHGPQVSPQNSIKLTSITPAFGHLGGLRLEIQLASYPVSRLHRDRRQEVRESQDAVG